jgi:hypothetical protein
MRYVDTGDRIFDNSLIALVSLTLSSAIIYIFNNYKYIYNSFIYYALKAHKTPTDFTKLTYLYEETGTITEKYTHARSSGDIAKYITKLMKKNISQTISKNKFAFLTFDGIIDLESGLIPVYISSGRIVYAESKYGEINVWASSLHLLNEAVGYFMNAMENEKKEDEKPGQKLFISSSESGVRIHCTGYLSTKKTFDTLFYDDKENLLTILTKFKNKTLYPPNISMDNKLGILLYGPPGTGKTGTISAIANFLKRDVLSINFSEITTCKQFDEALSNASNKNNIIIFDEFDCILDAVLGGNSQAQKKITPEEPAKMNWGELLAAAEGEERKKILDMIRENKKVKPEEPINLAYLLSKLDGLESNEDRIIIATTNNPDKINPVLLRPGRIDLKICLGNCSTKMYRDILTNFFQLTEEQSDKINWCSLPEKRYSPLVVINTALKFQDVHKTIQELK